MNMRSLRIVYVINHDSIPAFTDTSLEEEGNLTIAHYAVFGLVFGTVFAFTFNFFWKKRKKT